ncbi:hypothetical protein [Glacieibacterium sp.]|uniref:hypothetical protein n=1 Tax=Glacieibacterium sp. TaxID=2860237 RepID=UPI003B0072E5
MLDRGPGCVDDGEMARSAPLKVYRTPIGFHDAYVAASSQKAALKAWGSGHDLFGTGEAEVVTDSALTKEPLARPGEVIRRLRATAAEQIASLPDKVEEPPPEPPEASAAPRQKPEPEPKPKPALKPKPKPKPAPKPRPPKPGDDHVVAARQALDAATKAAASKRRDLDAREQALQLERRQFEQAQAKAAAALQDKLDRTERKYRAALAAWKALL